MGYTHYWKSEEIDTETFGVLAAQARDVARIADEDGVKIVYESDETFRAPVFTEELIRFNGHGADGHETFMLSPNNAMRDFCKTAQKPYDIVVVAILCLVAHKTGMQVSSDGSPGEWQDGLDLARKIVPECQLPTDVEGH